MTSPARLMNPTVLRQQIKRLFSGNLAEIFGELLQNSQRAGATQVTVTTLEINQDEGIITFSDNGRGVATIADFESLLCIGESNWDNLVNTNQQPMGLGIQALLATEAIKTITMGSHKHLILIDTRRWWNDLSYAESWKERVRVFSFTTGLTLSMACDPKLLSQVRHLFETAPTHSQNLYEFTDKGIARGYEGILSVTVDGIEAPTTPTCIPAQVTPLFDTTFEGCPLTVGVTDELSYSRSVNTINWYGQLIRFSNTHFPLYLNVKAGHPLDLKAPTRSGPIENDKLAALNAHVKKGLATYFREPLNTKPKHFQYWLESLTPEERLATPHTVGMPWVEPVPGNDSTDFDQSGKLAIIDLREGHPFLSSEVTIKMGSDTITADKGLTSFLPLTGDAFCCPITDERVHEQTLWWKPGTETEVRGDVYKNWGGTHFHAAGEWGLSDSKTEPATWHPVGDTPVVACVETSSYDVNSSFIFTSIPQLAFYEDDWAMIGFYPYDDENGYDTIKDRYDGSVANELRDIIGDCVPHGFTIWDLEALAPAGTKVTLIAITDERIERSLVVTFSDGSTKNLTTTR